jgi:effector-binding domain-containing protein
MDSACRIERLQREPTLALRTRTPIEGLPRFLGTAYGTVVAFLASRGKHPAGPPFALYRNMDMKDLDVEAGFPVRGTIEGADPMVAGEIECCDAATCTHVGSYESIHESYDSLIAWMEREGYAGNGQVYEFYLNDPSVTPADRLRTRIVLPLCTTGVAEAESFANGVH